MYLSPSVLPCCLRACAGSCPQCPAALSSSLHCSQSADSSGLRGLDAPVVSVRARVWMCVCASPDAPVCSVRARVWMCVCASPDAPVSSVRVCVHVYGCVYVQVRTLL